MPSQQADRQTIDVNGYKIRYLEFGDVNSDEEKNNKIVILLHGMAGSVLKFPVQ
jgi:hypothetical protein